MNRIYSLLVLLFVGSTGLQAQEGDPFPDVNIYKYQGNMNITAMVMQNGAIVTDAIVAVYCEDEIRGKKSVGAGTNPELAFLTVYGDYTGNKQYLHFKVYTDGKIFTCNPDPAITYTFNGSLGTISAPYVITLPVSLVDNANNSDVLTTYNDATCDVVLTGRTLSKSGNWNTLCLPFDLASLTGTPLESATIKELDISSSGSGFNEETGVLTLKFITATSIIAGRPYIVKWESNSGTVSNPIFSNVTINNEDPANHSTTSSDKKVTFIGTYSPVPLPKDVTTNLYMGANSTLYYPNVEDFYVNAFRAYFQLDPSASVKAFVLNFEDDSADGFKGLKDSKDLNDGAWLTIDGRKLSGKPMQRGIYIHNGRKEALK